MELETQLKKHSIEEEKVEHERVRRHKEIKKKAEELMKEIER